MGSCSFTFISFFSLALSHGIIRSPPPRLPGPAMKAACGEQVYNNQNSDHNGNIQGILQVARTQKDYDASKCNVWICKGYQFEDNKNNVQTLSPGQTIDMVVTISAPHTGIANVSVVNTQTNKVIGQPLMTFQDYASNQHTIPKDNSNFEIKMPDLGDQCTQAGACVVQWFWDAPDIKQTYESCIDFAMSGTQPVPKADSVAAGSSAGLDLGEGLIG